MRTHARLVIAGVLFVSVVAGCAEGVTDTRPPATPHDPLAQEIVALGFQPDMIEDHGEYFLVEGDIVITKEYLLQRLDTAKTQLDPELGKLLVIAPQFRTHDLVALNVATNIRVRISGAESTWRTAINAAIAEWNSVHPNAQISISVGSSPHITFSMSNLNYGGPGSCSGTIATAEFPNGTTPGRNVRISNQFTNDNCLSSSRKKQAMVHEIGHTLGFRHTNWRTRPDGAEDREPWGAITIPGTPQTDDQSVMNAFNTSWTGFSQYDKIAAFHMYPPEHFGGGINGPEFIFSPGEYVWTTTPATGGTGSFTYIWYIQYPGDTFLTAYSSGLTAPMLLTSNDCDDIRWELIVSSGVRQKATGLYVFNFIPCSPF